MKQQLQGGPKDDLYRASTGHISSCYRFDERTSHNEATKILQHAFLNMKSEHTTYVFANVPLFKDLRLPSCLVHLSVLA